MNSRISLFKFEFKLEYKELVKKLLEDSYSPEKLSGFILKKANASTIAGQHIFKHIKIIEEKDPFGNIVKSEIEQYLINDFVICDGFLELHNSTKSLSQFKESLSKVFSHSFILEPLKIDFKLLINEVYVSFKSSVVQALEVSSYDLITDCHTTINVKGNTALTAKVDALFEDRDYAIKKAVIYLEIEGENSLLEVNEKGSVKLKTSYVSDSNLSRLTTLIKGHNN